MIKIDEMEFRHLTALLNLDPREPITPDDLRHAIRRNRIDAICITEWFASAWERALKKEGLSELTEIAQETDTLK